MNRYDALAKDVFGSGPAPPSSSMVMPGESVKAAVFVPKNRGGDKPNSKGRKRTAVDSEQFPGSDSVTQFSSSTSAADSAAKKSASTGKAKKPRGRPPKQSTADKAGEHIEPKAPGKCAPKKPRGRPKKQQAAKSNPTIDEADDAVIPPKTKKPRGRPKKQPLAEKIATKKSSAATKTKPSKGEGITTKRKTVVTKPKKPTTTTTTTKSKSKGTVTSAKKRLSNPKTKATISTNMTAAKKPLNFTKMCKDPQQLFEWARMLDSVVGVKNPTKQMAELLSRSYWKMCATFEQKPAMRNRHWNNYMFHLVEISKGKDSCGMFQKAVKRVFDTQGNKCSVLPATTLFRADPVRATSLISKNGDRAPLLMQKTNGDGLTASDVAEIMLADTKVKRATPAFVKDVYKLAEKHRPVRKNNKKEAAVGDVE